MMDLPRRKGFVISCPHSSIEICALLKCTLATFLFLPIMRTCIRRYDLK